jgi:hypothetical protein
MTNLLAFNFNVGSAWAWGDTYFFTR